MRDRSALGELRIQLVIFGMCNYEVGFSPGVDPLGKAIGYALGLSLDVRGPGQHDLWPCAGHPAGP
jgi:hypothetical protein